MSGLWPPTWSSEYDDAKESLPWPEQEETGYIRIRRGDFAKYVTGELGQLCSMWKRIKNYGLPQGRGYLAEPRFVMDVVRLFDCEVETYRRWRENQ